LYALYGKSRVIIGYSKACVLYRDITSKRVKMISCNLKITVANACNTSYTQEAEIWRIVVQSQP
jgi:hypothetical protein